MWWGLSPAQDIVLQYSEACKEIGINHEDKDSINVLALNMSDARHILQTLANMYKHTSIKYINWYMYEPSLDLVARQILLLSIALATPEELGPNEKVKIFMQIYGNVRVPIHTADFLSRRAIQLKKLTTNLPGFSSQLRICDISLLTHKERDYLQDVFTFWSNPPKDVNVPVLWDKRMRSYLGVRYNTRLNVFDWDYHMRIRAKESSHLTVHEYKHWRNCGVAFTWLREENYLPNPTVLSATMNVNGQVCKVDYRGEIENGPYASFTQHCNDPDMQQKCSDMYLKKVTDVTERNLTRMFHEIETGEPYVPLVEENENMYFIPDLREDDNLTSSTKSSTLQPNNVEPLKTKCITSTKVHFMSAGDFRKTRYAEFFDMVVIPDRLMPKSLNLIKMLKNNAIILQENCYKFLLEVKQNELTQISESAMKNIQERFSCEKLGSFDAMNDDAALFQVVKRNTETNADSNTDIVNTANTNTDSNTNIDANTNSDQDIFSDTDII